MKDTSSSLSLVRLQAQFIKEILSVLRDPRSRMVIFVPPILQLMIFAFAATLEVKNVDIVINNQDMGLWSHEYISHIDKAEFTNKLVYVDNQDEMHDLIDQGKTIAGLTFLSDFSRNINYGHSGKVQVLIDGRRSNSGQIALSYLTAIASNVSSQINMDVVDYDYSPIIVRHWFNPSLNHRWFIVPGLTGILALFSALMITSLSIARERELGTFDQLMVSPASTLEIIIAKSLPAMVIGTILGLFMVAAGIFVFGIPFTGIFSLLVLSLMLFILSKSDSIFKY